MKILLILYSYHHNNTEKIANAMAKVLDAKIKKPWEVEPEELQEYSLVGFGSGIYDEKHQHSLLELAERLPRATGGKAFLFSTAGITGEWKVEEDHAELRERLESKGYTIVDNFQCLGHNTNSFLKFFGGMNKGRPNAGDLKSAEEFAMSLVPKIR
jgi:flavodoxin